MQELKKYLLHMPFFFFPIAFFFSSPKNLYMQVYLLKCGDLFCCWCRVCPLCRGNVCRSDTSSTEKLSWSRSVKCPALNSSALLHASWDRWIFLPPRNQSRLRYCNPKLLVPRAFPHVIIQFLIIWMATVPI